MADQTTAETTTTQAGFVPDELVVALPHQRLVEDVLGKLCPGLWEQAAHDRALGLALYKLVDEAAVAAAIRHHPVLPGAVVDTTIERLLAVLRQQFSADHGGWMPTLGKNRNVRAVFAAPHIGTGTAAASFGYPVATDPFTLPRASGRELGRGVRVAVLDTGLYPNELLSGRYIADSASVLTTHPDTPPSHFTGHSTFIAGLVLAQAPNAWLDVHDVLKGAMARTTTWDLAATMVRLAGSGTQILNLSLACVTEDGQPPLVLSRAVDLLSPEMVVVAAAGNIDGALVDGRKPMWPAALDKVVAVGACHHDGTVADFSVQGPWVQLYAPGVDVPSVYFDCDVKIEADKAKLAQAGITENPVRFGGSALWSGTSFAAATVSGQIAALTGVGESAYEGLQRLRHRQRAAEFARARAAAGVSR